MARHNTAHRAPAAPQPPVPIPMAFTPPWPANMDPSMQNASAYFASMSPEQRTMLFAQFQMVPPPPPVQMPQLPMGVNRGPQPSIQPDLEVASALHEVRGALAEIKNDVDNLKRKRDDVGDNDIDVDDADDADDEREKSVRRRRANQAKRSRGTTYKLNQNTGLLSEKERTTRAELQKYVKLLTKTLTKASESDSDSDSDDSDDDTGTNQTAPKEKFSFDFQKDVNVAPNDGIIQRVTDVIYEQHSNAQTSRLTHKDVHYTKKDVEAFAKANYRYLRRIYLTKTSEAKSIKRARQIRKNKRLARQRQLLTARSRPAVLAEYQARYEIDPMPLLMDPSLMSEEVSELSEDDENRVEYKEMVQEAAGLSKQDIDDGVDAWEIVKPAHRVPKYEETMKRLDKIRHDLRKASKKKLAPMTKRVNLGRTHQNPPACDVFPFMLDVTSDWYIGYLVKHPNSPIVLKKKNPPGFDEATEAADNSNTTANDEDEDTGSDDGSVNE